MGAVFSFGARKMGENYQRSIAKDRTRRSIGPTERKTLPETQDNADRTRSGNRSNNRGMRGEIVQFRARRTMNLLQVCSWVTAAAFFMARMLVFVSIFFLIRGACFEIDSGTKLIKDSWGCLTSLNSTLCSEVVETAFPKTEIQSSYRLWFVVSASDNCVDEALYSQDIPLLIKNPVIMLLALLATLIFSYFSSCLHQHFLAVANAVDEKVSFFDQALAKHHSLTA